MDIVSKGGNYLLNVGPTAEGEIPAESIRLLKEVGAWMKVNGESIYGTQASPFEIPALGKMHGETGWRANGIIPARAGLAGGWKPHGPASGQQCEVG